MNRVELIQHSLENNIDSDVRNLYQKVDQKVSQMNEQGYKVISTIPLTGSYYDNSDNASYGVSFTSGIILIFEEVL